MTWDYPDPCERDELHAEDLHVADLLGDYIHRRETGATPCLHDLLASAAELGPHARRKLRTVAAFYETALTNRR
jgi:hypothetical protein